MVDGIPVVYLKHLKPQNTKKVVTVVTDNMQ